MLFRHKFLFLRSLPSSFFLFVMLIIFISFSFAVSLCRHSPAFIYFPLCIIFPFQASHSASYWFYPPHRSLSFCGFPVEVFLPRRSSPLHLLPFPFLIIHQPHILALHFIFLTVFLFYLILRSFPLYFFSLWSPLMSRF